MPFPESPRVIYGKNPLEEVICQLRFPSILRIGAEIPAAFQERIRKEYPFFKERGDVDVSLPQEIVQQLPAEVLESLIRTSGRVFDFVSSDELWTVTLSKEFLALTTRQYVRWEDFQARLIIPFQALIEVYEPVFFTRIGLRYQNLILKSRLGIDNIGWSDLLQPYILGELSAPDQSVVNSILGTTHQALFSLDKNQGEVRVTHGLVQHKNGEKCYLIDSDFFIPKNVEVSNALDTLDYFNRKNRQLFSWCITERLHQSMEPSSI